MGTLDGKIAVITGSTRGIGLAIAEAYAREGAAVVISSRTQAAVDAAVQRLQAAGYRAAGLACDVSQPEQVSALAQLAVQTFGKVDIWFNNAGLETAYGPTMSYSAEDFTKVVQTNILGVYHGSRTALQLFLPQRSGKLINMVGKGYKSPAPYQNAYGASKAWVLSFTKALAQEYADSGVDILNFSPGMVITDMLTQFDVVQGHEHRLKAFPAVLRILGRKPDYPARKAVWAASSATDGKTGLLVNSFSLGVVLQGLFKEIIRLIARRPSDLPEIHMRSVPPVE
ncbi:SDR family NAD(P)-dependent oxidoreductase [Levilinea saccharolytica]|nr:SDR family NAD(P)-dependent oxidoreductase [Levilinea saccharolytica]GAP16699.1 dehydrogenase related to short-chain alcohol dehydrogenases [Levilinea saccharolytica]